MSGAFQAFGWLLCAAGLCVPVALATQVFTRQRRQKELDKLRLAMLEEELKNLREEHEKRKALPAAWSGKRKFRIVRKVMEGGGICSFYLAPNDGKLPLPEFKPGQFLTFDIPIKGKKVVRCYSISDCYSGDFYRISVKRVTAPPKTTHPPGLVSSHLHENVMEGDILDVQAPAGSFVVDPRDTGGLVLCGAGVGVTPVYCMVKALMAARSRREVWFFYSVRNGGDSILRDRIKQWKGFNLPNFHFVVCYSDPAAAEAQGTDYDHAERIGVDLFKKVLPSNNFDFFTCGPPAMMRAVRDGLMAWGVPEDRIHDEAFMQEKREVQIAAASVTFKRSDKTVKITGPVTNLLDFADKEGIRIPYGCRAGDCGTCQVALLEGSITNNKNPGFKVEAGCCLPCICLPKGDIVIDA